MTEFQYKILEINNDDFISFLKCTGINLDDIYVFAQEDYRDKQYYKSLYNFCDSENDPDYECEENCCCDLEYNKQCKNKKRQKIPSKIMQCRLKYIGQNPKSLLEDISENSEENPKEDSDINSEKNSDDDLDDNLEEDSEKQMRQIIDYYGHEEYKGNIYVYKYRIVGLKKISDTQYLYVVERSNANMIRDLKYDKVDLCYQLKFYDNGIITIDWIIRSYNPFAGCSIFSLDYEQENMTATIHYSSKGNCFAKIKANTNGNHNILHVGEKVGCVIQFERL